ncbi:MAG: hypothetical protein Wins2KO_28810 [Winogradskyella sp.]|uniref:hypothetical protein n=1 Tax=Winogradskyella sp. TaxID=1883156 RepID=UPI0025CE83D0|nr:hypothetical protein [Winogradskyella sp.]NRB60072.1 hypothetical protein [Winogradskyella sp.]
MELVLNQELETLPEPVINRHFTNNGLLNTNYKSIVKDNFKTSTERSVFSIKQRVKSSQFRMVNHTAAIIKLSVFFIAVIAMF